MALPSIAFQTFGCRLNQAEAEGWQRALAAQGYPIVEMAQADVFCVHSCAVTEPAVKEVAKLVRSVRKSAPQMRVILSGCAAELVHETVDLRLPHAQKAQWLSHVTAYLKTLSSTHEVLQTSIAHRTRATLILQDGCDQFCAYCIVPHLRGAPVSEPASHLLQEAERLFAIGYREIVLTGCHLALYKDPERGMGFVELLQRLCDVKGEGRFRIGSLEPCIVDDAALIRLIATAGGRICPFLHFPMQSADDELLRRMGRRYAQRDLCHVVETVGEYLPRCGLSADWIAGLPGETEAAFQHTLAFIQRYPFTDAHVFPYSKREGTPAVTFPNQVPQAVIQQRAKALREAAKAQQLHQLSQWVGQTFEVIPEQAHGDIRFGWTAERFRCRLPAHYPRGERCLVTPSALEGETFIVTE